MPRGRPVRVFGALFVFWAIVYFGWTPESTEPARGDGSYHAMLTRGDGHYMYLATLSLVLDRDLDLTNQFHLAGDPFGMAGKRQRTGRHAIYPIGTSILQIPFFLVAEAAAGVADVFGAGIPLHGHTYFHQRITFLGAMLAGFFTLVFGYRIARRRVAETAALWGAILAGVTGPITYYALISPAYAHAWTAFTVALALDTWDRTRGRHDLLRWIWIGLTFGLAALSREQELIFALIPAGEGVIEIARRIGRREFIGALRVATHGLLAAELIVMVMSPSLIANRIVFGGALANPAGAHYMRWSAPFFWETLYSSKNGLFIWTPMCYLGVLGLFAAPRRARGLAAVLLGAFVLDTWVNGSAWAWWSDASFSNRRFVDATVIFAVGLGFLVERLRGLHARHPRFAPHAALALATAPFVVANIDLACTHVKPRSDVAQPISEAYGQMARRLLDRATHGPLGSPTTWPASWIWGVRHGVSAARWDTLVGAERLFISPEDLGHPGKTERDILHLDEGTVALLGDGGIDPPATHGGPVLVHDGGRMLVPLFIAENVGWTLDLTAPAGGTIVVNGEAHDIPASPSAEQVPIAFAPGTLHPGVNEVVFHTPGDLMLTAIELEWRCPR